jgi:hypothetical protein
MSGDPRLALSKKKVTVTVSATTETGTEVSQSYEFEVPATAKDSDILAMGSSQFRAIGGFFVDDGNDLLFYLAYQMKGPIRFSVNRIAVPSLMS